MGCRRIETRLWSCRGRYRTEVKRPVVFVIVKLQRKIQNRSQATSGVRYCEVAEEDTEQKSSDQWCSLLWSCRGRYRTEVKRPVVFVIVKLQRKIQNRSQATSGVRYCEVFVIVKLQRTIQNSQATSGVRYCEVADTEQNRPVVFVIVKSSDQWCSLLCSG